MNKPEIKAGMSLDIVFENELNQTYAHYMKAVVYDLDQNFLIISQTSPALNVKFLNRRMVVTFLIQTDARVIRFGFSAKLIGFIPDYEISSGTVVEAIKIQKNSSPEPTDFRMYFRVKPPLDADVGLFIESRKVNLLDISIGGAKFTCPRREFNLRPGDTLKFKLIIGNESFDVDALIRNVSYPDAVAANRNIQYISVAFRHDDKTREMALGKAIMDIERSLLSSGKV